MKSLRALPLVLFGAMPLAGCTVYSEPARTQDAVYVEEPPAPPPPVVVETAPPAPAPAPDVYWIPGEHRWTGHGWVWVGGRYERRPYRSAHWIPGHWERRGRGHIWIEAHWG